MTKDDDVPSTPFIKDSFTSPLIVVSPNSLAMPPTVAVEPAVAEPLSEAEAGSCCHDRLRRSSAATTSPSPRPPVDDDDDGRRGERVEDSSEMVEPGSPTLLRFSSATYSTWS